MTRFGAEMNDAVKILLDIDKALTTDQLVDMASAARTVESSKEPGATAPVD